MSKQKTIAVDLDGVIANYSGWKGGYHFGLPNPEGVKLLEMYRDAGFRIVITTCRLNESWKDKYDYNMILRNVEDYLFNNCVPFDHIATAKEGKVFADVYIDDKCVLFPMNVGPAEEVFKETLELLNNHPDDFSDVVHEELCLKTNASGNCICKLPANHPGVCLCSVCHKQFIGEPSEANQRRGY